jgi:hypothetical protein
MTNLDNRIKELCERKGLTFKPWEPEPWEVHEDLPEPTDGTVWSELWPKAVALRLALIRELQAEIKL